MLKRYDIKKKVDFIFNIKYAYNKYNINAINFENKLMFLKIIYKLSIK